MLLKSLSSIYDLIVTSHHKLYQSKIKKSYKLSRPVVVVGNITAGGTGKTPFVDYLIKVFKKKSVNIGVISRGYRGDYSGVVEVDLLKKDKASYFGDEPVLLKSRHIEVPIFLSPKRHLAGKSLLTKYPDTKLIICDDGFQHFSLDRDMNIVLIDCTEKLSNYKLLPAGRLREPLDGLKRANFIVFTKSNWAADSQFSECKKLVNKYFALNSNNHAVANYISEYPELTNKSVLLVSSIAHPELFSSQLKENTDLIVKDDLRFKDHHVYSSADIDKILMGYRKNNCDWILTTEKDFVKLNEFDLLKDKLKVVKINVEIITGEESLKDELFKTIS